MSLDFQQIHEQVRQLGENAPQRERRLAGLREQAHQLLQGNAHEIERLREKVHKVVHNHDATLRCALPVAEPLIEHVPLPALPPEATLLAADGSQINPDRHAAVEYCLINVGTIQMRYGSSATPTPGIRSQLLYDTELYTPTGTLTDALVALRRDLAERRALVDLAGQLEPPVITITDGPLELWGAKDEDGGSEFQQSLQIYLASLSQLQEIGATTAGYVDKPGADLVVRLLEVAATPDDELADIHRTHRLRGVTDFDLYNDLLAPGERSAVFAMQSKSAENYRGPLALHFFYLNVGRAARHWLARVEVPAWVAESKSKLDQLHALLIHQCGVMGNNAYPYLLHRAHEAAVVTLEEKEQLTEMIVLELRRRGMSVGDVSQKQAAKEFSGRSSYRAGGTG